MIAQQEHDQIVDLLAKRVTVGLNGREATELESLLERTPAANATSFERVAAAVHVAVMPLCEPPPAHLRAKLEEDAGAFVGGRVLTPLRPKGVAPARRRVQWSWLATAAALLLAVSAWWPAIVSNSDPDFAKQRAALIASGAAVLPWTATEDPAAASAIGDVVWSDVSHTGFMRISMLSANEPTSFQYQLWIFDAERDERYPVDGGLFDVPAGVNEVIIPIRAKLPVANAVLFAVTVEAPGGAVVSSRERIVLLANVDASA
jgi:hypothetical protein